MEHKKFNSSLSKNKCIKNKNISNNEEYFSIKYDLYKNLPYFSYKILEAKHSTTPELYQQILLNNLIMRKKSHFNAYLNEIQINTNLFRELLKRLYTYEESKERIPKYVSYYQNYLKFFCRPIFGDYLANKKMVKHMEKVAQIFYNENYAEEDELENSKHQNFNFKVFNKTIKEEIDNYDNYTRFDNDNENKKNKNDKEGIKSKTIDINKEIFYIQNNNLDLLENVYKITPILITNKINKYRNKRNNKKNKEKDNSCSNTTEYNSFQKIIKGMENKRNKKIKEGSHKKNNKISTHNSNIFDYFNNLSNILFSKKKKTFLNKNNIINKINVNKKKEKNNNKIINNINININHLTIGQKSINPLSEINNFHNSNCIYKKYKKRNIKIRKNNSMILKDKSFKNYINCFGNITSKNLEQKKKNNSFKFPINGFIGYNSNKYKKIKNINFTSDTNHTRNKSNIKEKGKSSNGYTTNLNKIYNKRKDSSKKRIGKIRIYTNNYNYIKNMYNILDINNNSKKIKHSNYNSNSINFNNINSFYKNSSSMSLSPLVWNINNKKNKSNNKGSSIISYERIRSTSNKSKKKNKIFNSGFNFKIFSKNISYNSHNFISPKNNILNNNLSRLKINNNKKERSIDNNISSPIYHENCSQINKSNSILKKRKFKEEQIFSYNKIINLKFKNLGKLSSLKKSLKIPKNSRNKSKGKNNSKKK